MLKRVAGRAAIVAVFAAFATFAASGQERPPRQFPAVEFWVGYSYANVSLGSQSTVFAPAGHSFNGAQIDAKFNLRKHIALLLDEANQWGSSKIPDTLGYTAYMQLYTTQFLAGPEFTLRARKFNAFAHTLVGLTRTTLNQPNGYILSITLVSLIATI
jgi:hypothetical protein